MKYIYALQDKRASYIRSLDLFDNDLVASREYFLMFQKEQLKNPSLDYRHYRIIRLGYIDNTEVNPQIQLDEWKEVEQDKVAELIERNIKEMLHAKGL